MRRTIYSLSALSSASFKIPVNKPGSSDQMSMVERWLNSAKKTVNPLQWKATSSYRRAHVVAFVIVVGSAGVFLGPWLIDQLGEATGQNIRFAPPAAIPSMSPLWWEQEWRRMRVIRSTEPSSESFAANFEFILAATGVDAAKPPLPATEKDPLRTALVPLCGDSTIVKYLAAQGYDVDAVDSSETAMRLAVERNESAVDPLLFSQMHLHWSDFFNPVLWNTTLRNRKYDFIYERQGMTSLNRHQREDYCFLLKQALKEDGILFVEAIFRTGRVAGNKKAGPPFSLSRKELRQYFPEEQGYLVKCSDAVDNAVAKLDRESRVLRRVPKELYVTTFPCVVAKKAVFAKIAAQQEAAMTASK